MPDLEKAREQLLAMREVYNKRIAALHKDLHHTEEAVEKDFAEQVTQRENEAVLGALDDEARDVVNQLNMALKRLDDGDYGICMNCGEEISANRLEAVPYTTLCIRCAERKE